MPAIAPVTSSAQDSVAETADVDFPRPQKGSNTQHLLVTMLGEFWQDTDGWLPSHIIQELAADMDMTRSATATALSRLAGRGVLEHSNAGRNSLYRFTPKARARLKIGFELISTFGDSVRRWDQKWTVIAFSIPESSRDLRDVFRSRLRWLGFAPLYGALWVSPRDTMAETERVCKSYGVDDHMIFRIHENERTGKDPVRAWSLENSGTLYRPFIDRYSPWLTRAIALDLSPAAAFRLRTEAMDEWRRFPYEDPDLPFELLPGDWLLPEARNMFVELYSSLTLLAERHLRDRLAAGPGELHGNARLAKILA